MKLINNLSIGNRLVILVSLSLVIVVATAIIGIINNRRLAVEINLGYEAITRPLGAVGNARGQFNSLRIALYDLAHDFNSNEQNLLFKKQILQNLSNYEQNIILYKEILDLYGTSDLYERESVDYLYEQLIPLREYVEYISAIAGKTGYEADAVRMLRGDFLRVADGISLDLARLIEILEAQALNEANKANEMYRQLSIMYVLIMLFSALALLLAAYLIVISITRPLKEMTSVATDLSKGKLDVHINHSSKSEIGILASGFEGFMQSVTGIITDMQALAQNHSDGDIEYFIDTKKYQGSYLDMVTGINGMMLTAVNDIKTIVYYLQSLTSGGYTERLERFPGKKGIISDSIDELVSRVHYDMLTGIHNRRYMEEALPRIIKTICRLGGGPLSILMIDIDYFKLFNDTYGHAHGDECLRIVAKAIAAGIIREDDFAARYGGEEFVVVLPNTGEPGACAVADRILQNVRACNISHEKSNTADHVTVSIGVATRDAREEQGGAECIKWADQMLYESKRNGRNRYTLKR